METEGVRERERREKTGERRVREKEGRHKRLCSASSHSGVERGDVVEAGGRRRLQRVDTTHRGQTSRRRTNTSSHKVVEERDCKFFFSCFLFRKKDV